MSNTLNLKNIQNNFYQYLIASPNDFSVHQTLLKHIQTPNTSSTATAKQRLNIYQDAYRLRLLECLKLDFPNLLTLMGIDAFQPMCQAYILQYPSQHFSIRYFGQFLSIFLKTTQPYAKHGFFSEMAAFEWMQGETLDAPDAQILTSAALTTYPLAQLPLLCLQFHPSMRTLDCHWDTPTLSSDIEQNQETRTPIQQHSPICWVLWRKGLECMYRSCSPEEAYALLHMKNGMSFSSLCEGLCQYKNEAEVPSIAIQFVLKWLSEGLISFFKN